MSAKIAYRIMACKSRDYIVKEMLKSLDGLDVQVFYDDRPEQKRIGTSYTQMLCINDAIMHMFDYTHICLLQDDLLLVNDFDKCLHKLIEHNEHGFWGLYCSRLKKVDYERPYVKLYPANTWGQANLFPIEMAIDIVNYRREVIPNYIYDDGLYLMYLYDHYLPAYTLNVGLCQHLCPTKSTLGYNNKNKVTKVFDGLDVYDKINWDNHEEKAYNFADVAAMERDREKYGRR